MTDDRTLALQAWYVIEMLTPVKKQDVRSCFKCSSEATELPKLPWEKKAEEEAAGLVDLSNDGEDGGEVDGLIETIDESAGSNDIVDAEDPAEAAGEPTKSERGYILYLGLAPQADCSKAIRKSLALHESFGEGERAGDYCALGSIRTTIDGRFIRKSLVVSTLPWYPGRIEKRGLAHVLDQPVSRGFEDFQQSCKDELFPPDDEPATAADIRNLVMAIGEKCGAIELPLDYVYAGKMRPYDPDEMVDLLNSFYHEDVAESIDLLRHEGLPPLAQALFTSFSDRIEVYRGDGIARKYLPKNAIPVGAWPGTNGRPALMQQMAIVLARGPESGRIVAVNGPPGTGKTTLLRSFIAQNIVKRAMQLVHFETPSRAWSKLSEARTIHRLAPEICGYEMLVASMNNGAIQNITNDIPLIESVPGWEAALGSPLDHALHATLESYANT